MLCSALSTIRKLSLLSGGQVGVSLAQAVSIVVHIITLFDLPPKYSGTVSPDMYCSGNGTFTTNR